MTQLLNTTTKLTDWTVAENTSNAVTKRLLALCSLWLFEFQLCYAITLDKCIRNRNIVNHWNTNLISFLLRYRMLKSNHSFKSYYKNSGCFYWCTWSLWRSVYLIEGFQAESILAEVAEAAPLLQPSAVSESDPVEGTGPSGKTFYYNIQGFVFFLIVDGLFAKKLATKQSTLGSFSWRILLFQFCDQLTFSWEILDEDFNCLNRIL